MSKRITFTDFEIEQLVKGLEALKNSTALDYEVVRVGRRFYQSLIDKLQPPLKPGEPGYSASQLDGEDNTN